MRKSERPNNRIKSVKIIGGRERKEWCRKRKRGEEIEEKG